MNYQAHADILTAAYNALPERLRTFLATDPALLEIAANYPDLFDDPTRDAAHKDAIDPDWRRYCVFPASLAGPAMHQWPGASRDIRGRTPIILHLLESMVECLRNRERAAFIKFAGCLSHFFGDVTQPAHLCVDTQCSDIRELLPVPPGPEFASFNYHTNVEAVIGRCTVPSTPVVEGTSPREATWRLANRCKDAAVHCRRFIVPIVQALFRGDTAAAAAAASEPVQLATQLTADAIVTADALARNEFASDNEARLRQVDLRTVRPDREFHDSVYSTAVLDGNKNVPPNNVPPTPSLLRLPTGVQHLPGLGVLPHSGMSGPRECRMAWNLPVGIFRQFSSVVGMHAELALEGAASFHILFDGVEAWSSGRMTGADDTRTIAIDTPPDAQEIELLVVDGNDGRSFWKNHAFWGLPTLSK